MTAFDRFSLFVKIMRYFAPNDIEIAVFTKLLNARIKDFSLEGTKPQLSIYGAYYNQRKL